MSTNKDVRGTVRGACTTCECTSFMRSTELWTSGPFPPGWCEYCGHSPVSHVAVDIFASTERTQRTESTLELITSGRRQPDLPFSAHSVLNTSGSQSSTTEEPCQGPTAAAGTAGCTSAIRTGGGNMMVDDSSGMAEMPSTSQEHPLGTSSILQAVENVCRAAVEQSSREKFTLPEFSPMVQPLLKGKSLSEKMEKMLQQQLQDELIEYLDENQLIINEAPWQLREQYKALGRCLLKCHPCILWPSAKPGSKAERNAKYCWSVFMHRLSLKRKIRRLRAKWSKNMAGVDTQCPSTENSMHAVEILGTAMSCNEAQNELNVLASFEHGTVSFNLARLKQLLRLSYEVRRLEYPERLPVYFLNEDALCVEAELRFQLSIEEMVAKLNHVRQEFIMEHGGESFADIDCYLRSRKCKTALITLEDVNEGQRVPGPSLSFTAKKEIRTRHEAIDLSSSCSMEKALILVLCVYYVKNLSYPQAYGQTLGLLQTVLVKDSYFNAALQTKRLAMLLKHLGVSRQEPQKAQSLLSLIR
ncbi:uncharacterized protein LOC135388598 isoform X2 [Ornithodoros turicata]|uniref:uncharacterized protein LOC135371674 isoform X2 n=1 Tax=Ornithodoros turicata TaxID=34597 RepID=UPI00313893F9